MANIKNKVWNNTDEVTDSVKLQARKQLATAMLTQMGTTSMADLDMLPAIYDWVETGDTDLFSAYKNFKKLHKSEEEAYDFQKAIEERRKEIEERRKEISADTEELHKLEEDFNALAEEVQSRFEEREKKMEEILQRTYGDCITDCNCVVSFKVLAKYFEEHNLNEQKGLYMIEGGKVVPIVDILQDPKTGKLIIHGQEVLDDRQDEELYKKLDTIKGKKYRLSLKYYRPF